MSTDSQGPPLSIFGNEFHSRFPGPGQMVPPGNQGASTAEHASHCPPNVGMPPYSWQAGRTRCKEHRGTWCERSRAHSGCNGRFGDFLSRWTHRTSILHIPPGFLLPAPVKPPLTSTPGCFFLAAPRACLQAAFHLVASEQAVRSQ